MIELDTPFRSQARRSRSPTSASFDDSVWDVSYADAPNKTEADEKLLRTANWIAIQSKILRDKYVVRGLKQLGSRLSTVLAIATINRNFITATKLSSEAVDRAHEAGALALDYLAAQPITAIGGQSAPVGSFIESAVDAAESWLFDAYGEPQEIQSAPSDLATIAVHAGVCYSLQHGLNDLWNQCLWEGWYVDADSDGGPLWLPGNRRLATLIEAWRYRQQSNFLDFFWVDASVWAILPPEARRSRAMRTVLEVRHGEHRKIVVARPPCLSKRMPLILAEQAGYDGSYLAQYLDIPLPLDNRLTFRLILKAWHVISDLGLLLKRNAPDQKTLSETDARKLALLVEHRELGETLGRALGQDNEVVDVLVNFLTFKPKSSADRGHRGLWAAPLVPIPSEERLALALPALSTSAPLRKAEVWLEKGGLDDRQSKNTRGDQFERELRRKIKKSLAGNPLLTDARCAEDAVKRDSNFEEQIDLLVQIGSLLLVGEVKFHLTPADSHERYNHWRKLEAASEQARRKAVALIARPDVIARALHITEERAKELRPVPLVVDNQGFGLSLNIDGCHVTEAGYLVNCLGSGTLVTGAAIAPRTGERIQNTTVLYSNQAQAERDFERLLSHPAVLYRFIHRIRWDRSVFPTPSGIKLIVETPELGDFVGPQKEHARFAMALIDPTTKQVESD